MPKYNATYEGRLPSSICVRATATASNPAVVSHNFLFYLKKIEAFILNTYAKI